MTLRIADDVSVFCTLDPLGAATGQYKMFVRVGSRTHVAPRRITLDQLQFMEERSRTTPVAYLRVVNQRYWRFRDSWVLAHESLTSADIRAFVTAGDAAHPRAVDALPRPRHENDAAPLAAPA